MRSRCVLRSAFWPVPRRLPRADGRWPAVRAGRGAADDWLYSAIEVLATVLVWWRVASCGKDRGAWAALAGFATLWTMGDLGWTLSLDGHADPSYPNWTDAF